MSAILHERISLLMSQFSFWSFREEIWLSIISLSFCFSLSDCCFNKTLFRFPHRKHKSRIAFSPIALSLVWSPFCWQCFHIANEYCLSAICEYWKIEGSLKEKENRFPRAAIVCFLDFNVCFFFYLSVRVIMTNRRRGCTQGMEKGLSLDWRC